MLDALKRALQAAVAAGEAPQVEGDAAAVAAYDPMEALDSLEDGVGCQSPQKKEREVSGETEVRLRVQGANARLTTRSRGIG